MSFLHSFAVDQPPSRTSQEFTFAWLAHQYASHDRSRGPEVFEGLLRRVGAKAPLVEARAAYLPDFADATSSQALFHNKVATLDERMRVFESEANGIFERLLSPELPVAELFHVSCTGYVSPSPAQRWVTRHGRHQDVRVRHLYHMGCYAALPALHQAHAACAPGKGVALGHTELCTLHFDPRDPSLEAMVVHTLFADGGICYQMHHECPQGPSLRYLSGHEELIPNSEDAMSWGLTQSGFRMTLSKDVPGYVKKALPQVLARWLGDPGLLKDKKVIWAVHPGGPKIVDEISRLFELDESQVKYSKKILRERGNMSSATLPHIWNEILLDEAVASGTPVLTMAFGPGLTVSVAQLEVVR